MERRVGGHRRGRTDTLEGKRSGPWDRCGVFEWWGQEARLVEQHDLEFVEREATLQALRAAIESGEQPETAAADNVRSLAAMLGCVSSIEEGEPVDVAALLAARGAKL